MRLTLAGFDWDDGNSEKCRKHGVSLAEIEAMFSSHEIRIAPGPTHSHIEDRLIAVGRTAEGKDAVRGVHFPQDRGTTLYPAGKRPLHSQKGDRPL